jgi:hypothetical protein
VKEKRLARSLAREEADTTFLDNGFSLAQRSLGRNHISGHVRSAEICAADSGAGSGGKCDGVRVGDGEDAGGFRDVLWGGTGGSAEGGKKGLKLFEGFGDGLGLGFLLPQGAGFYGTEVMEESRSGSGNQSSDDESKNFVADSSSRKDRECGDLEVNCLHTYCRSFADMVVDFLDG